MKETSREIVIPREQLEVRFMRSSGPGGQNVNKVNTKAEVRFNCRTSSALTEDQRERLLAVLATRLTRDGILIVRSDRHREQGRNLAECLEKLHSIISAALTPPRQRKPTRPPASWREERFRIKRRRSEARARRARVRWDED